MIDLIYIVMYCKLKNKMKGARKSEFPSRMTGFEMVLVVVFIVAVYIVFLMGGLHTLLGFMVTLTDKRKVWLSEGGLWDHPEPNYSVLPFVAEFFASITAVPLAGGVLLYQALRYSYNAPVLVLYLWDCWMYTCAFFSHMLLWPFLNAVTLTSVLTNALYTFGMYGGLAGGWLKKNPFRWSLVICLWLIILWLVRVMPAWFGENGGVPALLTIQTPAVISALAGAMYCSFFYPEAFKLLSISGTLLCSAMFVSLIEVIWGKSCQPFFGRVPFFHILIHTLEQIGIYLYGVGVAAIEHKLRPVGAHARIEYIGIVPYFAITSTLTEDAPIAEPSSGSRRSTRLSGKRM